MIRRRISPEAALDDGIGASLKWNAVISRTITGDGFMETNLKSEKESRKQ